MGASICINIVNRLMVWIATSAVSSFVSSMWRMSKSFPALLRGTTA
jgi:hypothetical protein